MASSQLSSRALIQATVAGTVLQLAMVIAGHFETSVANLFGPLGVTISLLTGVAYAYLAKSSKIGSASLGGLLAGGLCALLGILVSYAMGDVPGAVLGFGTASSAVTGAIGGVIGWALWSRRRASA